MTGDPSGLVAAAGAASAAIGGATQAVGGLQAAYATALPYSNLLLGATVALSAAVGGLAIVQAANYEQTVVGFTTMLKGGKKAKAFLEKLHAFAAKTPFEIAGIETSSKKLLAYGFSAKEIIPTLRSIGNAVSALGGSQKDIDLVTLAIGQMKTKNKLSAQEMKQLTERGIPAWDILSKAMGKPTSELMKMAETGEITGKKTEKVIEHLLEGMNKRYPGMMKKQSKTLLGIWSNFKDNLTLTLRSIGEIPMPALKKWLTGMVNALSTFTKHLKKHGLAGAMKKAFPPSARLPLILLAGAIFGLLIPALIGLATSLYATGVALVVAFAPFVLIGMALAAVAYIIVSNWGGIVDVFRPLFPLFNKLGAAFKEVFSALGSAFAAVWKALKPVLKLLWDAFKPLMPVIKWIAIAIGAVLLGVLIGALKIIAFQLRKFAQVVNWVRRSVGTALSWLKKKFESITGVKWEVFVKVIKIVFATIAKIFYKLGKGALGWLVRKMSWAWTMIKKTVRSALKIMRGDLKGAAKEWKDNTGSMAHDSEKSGKRSSDAARNTGRDVKNATKDMRDKVMPMWSQMQDHSVTTGRHMLNQSQIAYNAIRDHAISTTTFLRDSLAPIWGSIQDIVVTNTNAAKDRAMGAWNFLKDQTNAVWKAIYNAIASAINKIVDIVNTMIPGKKFDLKKAPMIGDHSGTGPGIQIGGIGDAGGIGGGYPDLSSVTGMSGGFRGAFTGAVIHRVKKAVQEWFLTQLGALGGGIGIGGSTSGLVPYARQWLGIMSGMFGVRLSSGFRPGSITRSGRRSLHASGRALDLVGSQGQMAAAAQFARSIPGVVELLWQVADHYDHVHVGFGELGMLSDRTQPVVIHKDEMVLPANITKGLIKLIGGKGGGGSVRQYVNVYPQKAETDADAIAKRLAWKLKTSGVR